MARNARHSNRRHLAPRALLGWCPARVLFMCDEVGRRTPYVSSGRNADHRKALPTPLRALSRHFLPPEFLTAHESELIDIVLATYARGGRAVPRAAFLRHYVLGCAQMYVFSGGGLQALMSRLDARGELVTLPDASLPKLCVPGPRHQLTDAPETAHATSHSGSPADRFFLSPSGTLDPPLTPRDTP